MIAEVSPHTESSSAIWLGQQPSFNLEVFLLAAALLPVISFQQHPCRLALGRVRCGQTIGQQQHTQQQKGGFVFPFEFKTAGAGQLRYWFLPSLPADAMVYRLEVLPACLEKYLFTLLILGIHPGLSPSYLHLHPAGPVWASHRLDPL